MKRIIGGETEDDLERYVSNLRFRSYQDNFNSLHAQSVATCVEGVAQDEMIQNVVSMARKLNGDISQPFLQRLELARQLESLSKIRDEHILSTAKWLVNQGLVLLGISTLREIARFGWIVYRYPVLGRVELSWSEAAIMLPAVKDLFDKKIERN